MAITAVLLAGGESRRMGSDKATLLWDGVPLWKGQLEKLRALQVAKILVSARSDPPWRPVDVGLVVDAAPSRGPLSGLASALECVQTEHLLVLAVDMPLMTTEHLLSFCGGTAAKSGVIPILDGRPEPLAAVYPRVARKDFSETLSGTDFSLQSLITRLISVKKLVPVEIALQDHGLYKSVNEPQDLSNRAGL